VARFLLARVGDVEVDVVNVRRELRDLLLRDISYWRLCINSVYHN
jgi:hypothetical protein